jgi:trans-aconitate methyltransferase
MKWNPDLYTTKHAFVYEYGSNLIQLLAPQSGERILDLGCGSGQLTEQIRESGAVVVGIDKSEEMITIAKTKFPLIEFYVRDGASFSFEEPFDAVFSNATLHWILEKEKAVESIYNALKRGGRFIAEFGGKGNVGTIINQLRQVLKNHGYEQNSVKEVWYYPSLGEYASLLEEQGFRVTMAQHYDRPTELADSEHGIEDWLDMFASSFFEDIDPETKATIKREVQEGIKDQCFINGKWYADYKRLRVVAIKG